MNGKKPGDVQELDGAILSRVKDETWELEQDFVTEEGEDVHQVALDMIGPAGKAVLMSVIENNPMGPYHTAVYHGSKKELFSLYNKNRGSKIGRPKKSE